MGRAREIVEGIDQAEKEDEAIRFDRATGVIESQPEAPDRQSGSGQAPTVVALPTNIYD